jgi:hypothetical protein
MDITLYKIDICENMWQKCTKFMYAFSRFRKAESGKRNRCGGLPLRAYAFSACLSGAKAFLT